MDISLKIKEYIEQRAASDEFREFISDSLVKLCCIDNTPENSIDGIRERETAAFRVIHDLAEGIDLPGNFQLYSVDSERISSHPSYTPVFYSDDPNPYSGRSNLVYHLRPEKTVKSGRPLAFNAHIDTIAPHIPPFIKGPSVFGRGTCDDKGNVIVITGILRILDELMKEFGVIPGNELTFMFVIDEETGGNGSLSLALNRDFCRRFEGLIVLECCGNRAFPANRGALWYRIDLPTDRLKDPIRTSAEIILALEEEGRSIYRESNHPMFPNRPVQTCHGIIGPWGEHPSRICGYAEFSVLTDKDPVDIEPAVWEGVDKYTAVYGDKTLSADNQTPVVLKHFELNKTERGIVLRVFGSTGHMAAVSLNDGALTKAAYIVSELYQFDETLTVKLNRFDEGSRLTMEGGQSFLPTHSIEEIKVRIKDACFRLLKDQGFSRHEIDEIVTMDKLHNAAFAGDADLTLFRKTADCLDRMGLKSSLPPRGWGASCDARLFWEADPQLPIVTAGTGDLDNAHSDDERVDVQDICRNIGAFVLLSLEFCGFQKNAPAAPRGDQSCKNVEKRDGRAD